MLIPFFQFLIFRLQADTNYTASFHPLLTERTSYRSYLVFMKTSFACLATSGTPNAREALFDKFFLPFLSYQSSVTQITDMVNYSYQFLTQYLVQISEKGLARPHAHKRQRCCRRRCPTNTHTTHGTHKPNAGSITIHN